MVEGALPIVNACLLVLVLLLLLFHMRGAGRPQQDERMDTVIQHLQVLERLMEAMNQNLRAELSALRTEQAAAAARGREEMAASMRSFEGRMEAARATIDERLAGFQQSQGSAAREGREEMARALKSFEEALLTRMGEVSAHQKEQLEIFGSSLKTLAGVTEQRLEGMRQTVEARLKDLQEDNSQKLEQMRATVDEKLHATLEQRLGESFKVVSERLEQVHRGLGEMQNLASGVGDLKKVLTNVKTRGVWGEIQLGSILEQILTPEQYCTNVAIKKGSQERVEFAIRLPGRGAGDEEVLLPIDAKFPQEDYLRLVEAVEAGDQGRAEEAGRLLEARIKAEAKDIREKYIDPPRTTDFAVMFLPTESLYAEILRRPGLSSLLQSNYRVVIAGPTTMAALLNSLSVGFRTLAIEKRSSEVWQILGAVKTEFGRFGELLEKTKKKLDEASNTIDNASRKSRTIARKLKSVEEISEIEAGRLLALDIGGEETAAGDDE